MNKNLFRYTRHEVDRELKRRGNEPPLRSQLQKWKGIAFLGLLGAVAPLAAATPPNLVFACGPSNDLYQVLAACGHTYPRRATPAEAVEAASEGGGVLVLADEYPKTPTPLKANVFEQAAAKKLRLYVEFPSYLPDTKLGPITYLKTGEYGAVVERTVVASDAFGPELPKLRIAMIHDCHYLPVEARNAHLVLARVEGYDTAVYGLPKETHPILFEHPRGDLLVATTKLSQFVTARYAPTQAWGPVWRMILGWLQPGKAVPTLNWTPTVRPSFAKVEPLPTDAQKQAIRRGVQWYWKSRLFIHPDWPPEKNAGLDPLPPDCPVGDGSHGIAEAYIGKHIFHTGHQAVSRMPRNDCNGPVAGSLSLAAEVLGDRLLAETAVKLHDFIYRSELAVGPQSDPKHPSYGLVLAGPKWAYWHSDNAMSLMGFMLSAGIQKTDRWDEDIVRTTLANFRVTGPCGFRPSALRDAELQASGWEHYWKDRHVHLCPHMQSGIWCSYLWLYHKTGFKPLLERTKAGISMMMRAYPNWQLEANRVEQERCRMLLPLAWLVRVEDTPEHRRWLDTIAGYIIDLQDPSGAIPQIPGHVVGSNEGYGTGECAIAHAAGDPATDALYAINFAFGGMQEAAAATGNPKYAQSADRMADFFIRSQTRSEAHPELDGTWYRGFDFQKWDYWASDGDAGWGVWSTETGWTSGEILATLAVRELKTSRWEVAQKCTAAKRFEKYRETMLPDAVLERSLPKRVFHAALGKPVTLAHPPHPAYSAGGAASLTDGVVTPEDQRQGYLGFEGTDLVATVDLGQSLAIERLTVNCHQDTAVGVYLPTEVEFAIADENAKNFRPLAAVKNSVLTSEAGPLIHLFTAAELKASARYVRIRARNVGTIPAAHPAAGAKAWLFVDELLINPN